MDNPPRRPLAEVYIGGPKIEAKQGKTSCRYPASICFGPSAFLEVIHQFNVEMKVQTRKWVSSSVDTGDFPCFRR